MLKYGDKDLRKRWIGNVNTNTIHLGTTKIWPYIINVSKSDWVITLSTTEIPAKGGTITVTKVSRNIVNTWVNFIGTTNQKYQTTETETLTDFTVSSSLGTVNGNVITIPYNPNTTDRAITITVDSPTGGQIQTTVNQLKNVITYNAWNLTLSVSPTNIEAAGGTATITTSCSRTYSNSNGQPDGTETSVVNLNTNAGSISGTTLTIPANTEASVKTITVTATAQGLSKSVNITQAAAVVNTTKYYAVTTNAYQVKANGETKTVPTASGATASSYHGTVVFAVEDGPATLTASFVSKNVNTGTTQLDFIKSPIVNQLVSSSAFYWRQMFIGANVVTTKVMGSIADVTLTGYDTEAEAKANAVTKYASITIQTGFSPREFTVSDFSGMEGSLVSDEVIDGVKYTVYNFKLAATAEKSQYKFSYGTSSLTSSITRGTGLGYISSINSSIDIVDLTGYNYIVDGITKPTVVLFSGEPRDGVTIDTVAVTSGIALNTIPANYAGGDKDTIEDGDKIYVYEWLYDSSSWLKIGEFTADTNAQEVYVYKHGVENSLVQRMHYDLTNESGGTSDADKANNTITVVKNPTEQEPNQVKLKATSNLTSTLTVNMECTWYYDVTGTTETNTCSETFNTGTNEISFIPLDPEDTTNGLWTLDAVKITSINPSSDNTYNYVIG